MPLSAWLSFGGLLIAMAVQGGTMAFLMGGLFARVKTLESNGASATKLEVEMARLATAMAGLAERVGEIKEDAHRAMEAMKSENQELHHIMRNRLMVIPGAKG